MTYDFFLRVFRVFSETNCGNEMLWWRTDTTYAPVTFMVNCSDTFFWATADNEHLTPENIGVLEQAVADCNAVPSEYKHLARIYASTLFCARVRGMRPMRLAYPKDRPEIWPLYDACGPERTSESEGLNQRGEVSCVWMVQNRLPVS